MKFHLFFVAYGLVTLMVNDCVVSIPHSSQRGVLVIKGIRFNNPRQKVFDGSCCDHYRKSPTCRGSCNTILRICATESQRPPPSKTIVMKKFPLNLSSLLSSTHSLYRKPQKRLHHKRWSHKRLPHGSRFPSIKKNLGKTLNPHKLPQDVSDRLSLAQKLAQLSEVKISMSSTSSTSSEPVYWSHARSRRELLSNTSTDIAENQVEPADVENSIAPGSLASNLEILRPPFFDGSEKRTLVAKSQETQAKIEKSQNPNFFPFEPCTLGEIVTDILPDVMDISNNKKYLDLEVVFPFAAPWPVSFKLIIEAWNVVNNTQQDEQNLLTKIDEHRQGQLITRHVGKHALNGGAPPRSFKRSLEEGRELKYSIKVKCKTPYLGRKCSQRCETLLRSQTSRLNCTAAGEVTCLSGWTGDICNRPQCRKGCHKVHGYCTQPGECKCALGWRGKNCDECVPLPGCKHGFCSTKSYECICEEGWEGSYCSMPVCRSGCHNTKGYCKLPGECRCRIGWGGDTCDECKSLPGCAHGYCTKPLECRCNEGWTGILCDQPICRANCSEQYGSCTNPGECRCNVGWWGELCDTCFPYPGCKHGTCERPWECNCKPAWRGMNCDEDDHFKSYCRHHPNTCQNGGTCNDVLFGLNFTCLCPSLFTGRKCEYREATFPIFNRGSGRHIFTLAPPGTIPAVTSTTSSIDNSSSTATTTTPLPPTTTTELSSATLEKSMSSSVSHVSSEVREENSPSDEILKSIAEVEIVQEKEDSSSSPLISETKVDQKVENSSPVDVISPKQEVSTTEIPKVATTEVSDSKIEASEERYYHLKMEPLPVGKHSILGEETSVAEERILQPVEKRRIPSENINVKRMKYLHSVKKHLGSEESQNEKLYISPVRIQNSKSRSQTAPVFITNVSRLGDILAENLRRHAKASGKNTKMTAYKNPTVTKLTEKPSSADHQNAKKPPVLYVDIGHEDPETPGDEAHHHDNPRVNHIDQRARFLRHHDSVGLPPQPGVHTTYYPINQIKFVTQDDIPQPSSLNINPFIVAQPGHHTPHSNDFGRSTSKGPSSPSAAGKSFFAPPAIGKFVSHEDHEESDASEQSSTLNLEVPELTYFEENYDGRVHIGALGKNAPLEEIIRAYIELKKLRSL